MKSKKVYLDYETRSEADLKKVGAVKYAQHPSTEIICLYYKIGNGKVKGWRPLLGEPFPKDLREAMTQDGFLFKAHNALFEQVITLYVLPRYL